MALQIVPKMLQGLCEPANKRQKKLSLANWRQLLFFRMRIQIFINYMVYNLFLGLAQNAVFR